MKARRIGFVSTRLSGTDGVSLETQKWADVLQGDGHTCYYMAGALDTPPERSFLVPECHFMHPAIVDVYQGCFGMISRTRGTTDKIGSLTRKLKDSLAGFVERHKLDLLIAENALAIPLNLPLGLAITEFIMETAMPIIAHNHDFFWERKRFLKNACWDYLNKAFPPHLPTARHAVLNSSQDNQLGLRTGISARIIPNVMDYANPPSPPDDYADDLRQAIGIQPGEKLILQPTRIVQRKGIEHAVELVHRLKIPARLAISHAGGDEGDEYARRVREYAALLNVNIIFCSDIIGEKRGLRPDGRKIYSLADIYRHADLVTYPSTVEGFGNAFLEAVYYRRPIVMNNYAIYHCDIGPLGFKVVKMDEYVSETTEADARRVLQDRDLAVDMTECNYRIAKKFFSYEVLRAKLTAMLVDCFGA